jgi:hypothetical protein
LLVTVHAVELPAEYEIVPSEFEDGKVVEVTTVLLPYFKLEAPEAVIVRDALLTVNVPVA